MIRRVAVLLMLPLLAACAGGRYAPDRHVPNFAAKPFEPFNREDTVAIAMREWRLFGQPVDDELLDTRPPLSGRKAERSPGLWERVGEYWWIGQKPDEREAAWTGKHGENGKPFPETVDGEYAWSAAFISYVMRIAGAGDRFPYAANHASYVNAAAAGTSPILRARPPQSYAPKRGDLICYGRNEASGLRFRDLPVNHLWPGHCAIVVDTAPGMLSVVGGNVADAVAMTHVPLTPSGMLADSLGIDVDTRRPWFVVLQVLYDAETEPAADD